MIQQEQHESPDRSLPTDDFMETDRERIRAEILERAAKEQHRGWIGDQWLYDHAEWLAERVNPSIASALHAAVGSMPFIPEADPDYQDQHAGHADGGHVVVDDEMVVFKCSCGAEADDSKRFSAAERMKQFRLAHGDGVGRAACDAFAVNLIVDIWRKVTAAGIDCPPPISRILCTVVDAFERAQDAPGAMANDDDLTATLIDMAKQGCETDFRALAAAAGVDPGDSDALWWGTRARVTKGRPARAAATA